MRREFKEHSKIMILLLKIFLIKIRYGINALGKLSYINFDSFEAIRFVLNEEIFNLNDLQTSLVHKDKQKYICRFYFHL